MKTEDYKGIFGSILYTAMQTSPDILAIVTLLSRFPENPGRVHWVAAKRVLCYLKRSKDLELCYTKDSGADADTLAGGASTMAHWFKRLYICDHITMWWA